MSKLDWEPKSRAAQILRTVAKRCRDNGALTIEGVPSEKRVKAVCCGEVVYLVPENEVRKQLPPSMCWVEYTGRDTEGHFNGNWRGVTASVLRVNVKPL